MPVVTDRGSFSGVQPQPGSIGMTFVIAGEVNRVAGVGDES
jgi:hypothetical protein